MKTNENLTEEDQGPIAGMAALRDVEPPTSLVPTVMQRIAEPPTPSFWRWLTRPRRFELRLSPAGLGAFAAAGVLAVLALQLVPSRPGTPASGVAQETTASTRSAPAAELVQVRFVFFAPGAKKVSLAGDFNQWNADVTVLEPADGRGTFTATLPLRRGTHEYMFLVDGHWMTDPSAAERRPDGFGRENGVLRL